MRTYEMMLVLDPEMSKEQIDGFVEKVKHFLGDRGAEVLRVEEWGVHTLAYEIKKKDKGYYLLFYFNGDAALVAEMKKTLRLMGEVLRYLIVKGGAGDMEAFQQEGEPEQGEEPEQEEGLEGESADDQEMDVAAEGQ
jgi:small subunit ribosomal protein S6